ncbi:MAG: hypothetical protein ACUVTN_08885 [Thermodesulfobacteriota bacterium]
MNFSEARYELKNMNKKALFQLASEQKITWCIVGAKACSFYFQYKGFPFCLSEILGKSCPYEKFEEIETSLLEFKVYYRDMVSRSILLIGRITERRRKERKNNLRDLLAKARREFSSFVSDPSLLFLLGP